MYIFPVLYFLLPILTFLVYKDYSSECFKDNICFINPLSFCLSEFNLEDIFFLKYGLS